MGFGQCTLSQHVGSWISSQADLQLSHKSAFEPVPGTPVSARCRTANSPALRRAARQDFAPCCSASVHSIFICRQYERKLGPAESASQCNASQTGIVAHSSVLVSTLSINTVTYDLALPTAAQSCTQTVLNIITYHAVLQSLSLLCLRLLFATRGRVWKQSWNVCILCLLHNVPVYVIREKTRSPRSTRHQRSSHTCCHYIIMLTRAACPLIEATASSPARLL